MRRTDWSMRERTAEELNKLGDTNYKIAKTIGCGCSERLVKYWRNQEGVPSHFYLKRLHELGCDILYIITGVRQCGDTNEKQ